MWLNCGGFIHSDPCAQTWGKVACHCPSFGNASRHLTLSGAISETCPEKGRSGEMGERGMPSSGSRSLIAPLRPLRSGVAPVHGLRCCEGRCGSFNTGSIFVWPSRRLSLNRLVKIPWKEYGASITAVDRHRAVVIKNPEVSR